MGIGASAALVYTGIPAAEWYSFDHENANRQSGFK
jgi:hypothetical protein